ncbi:MAG TPA: hypothetical protein VEC12_07040 [Bacteroidia bacterium]|nr:hypothetical protein [Bacteroidia bacterium]
MDVSGVEANIKFHRFDKDMMEMDTNNVREAFYSLQKKYPEFLPKYYSLIVGLGDYQDSSAPELFKQFITFQPTRELYKKVQDKFPSTEKYNEEITEVFRHYKYYFSEDTLPEIVYFMGILKYGAGYDDNQVALGLDMYLDEPEFYGRMANLTNYLIEKMKPEYITRNVAHNFGYYKFAKYMKGNRFIDRMIYEGKIAYFIKAMMPKSHDSLILALNGQNLKWCEDNEWQIWKHYVDPEYKVLYTTNPDITERYFEEAPFTNAPGVPNHEERSSPRFAVWTGFKIIQKYMDKNPNVTLAQLMEETDSDKILKESKYKP